jgi:hypothetical protein
MKQEHDAALAYFDGHCSVEHCMEIPDRSVATWMVNAYAYLVEETGGSVLAARNHTRNGHFSTVPPLSARPLR